jgi:cystine transport system substrate-binding protein
MAAGVLVLPAVGGADTSDSPQSLRRENSALAVQSRAAVLSLYSLDSRLNAANARLVQLRDRTQQLRRQRASVARQLHVAHSGVTISQRRVAERLRLLYEQGDVSAVEVVFGSKNLDDALTALENLDRVVSQDQAVLDELQVAKGKLTRATRMLAARAASLAAATREAAATTASLEQTKAQRTAYISQLATQRRLNSQQISRLEEQARAATLRAQQLARVPTTSVADPVAPAPDPTMPAPAGSGAITVNATGYTLSGQTATGLPVGWGIVAVDPSVIPLGTHLTIPGYGDAVAADTGGAIVGASIDLWFPSSAEAAAWGRRVVTITLH